MNLFSTITVALAAIAGVVKIVLYAMKLQAERQRDRMLGKILMREQERSGSAESILWSLVAIFAPVMGMIHQQPQARGADEPNRVVDAGPLDQTSADQPTRPIETNHQANSGVMPPFYDLPTEPIRRVDPPDA